MSFEITLSLDTVSLNSKPTTQKDIAGVKSRTHRNVETSSLEYFAHEHCINGKALAPSIGNGTADGTTSLQMYVLDFDNKHPEPETDEQGNVLKDANGKPIAKPLPYDEQIKPADVMKRLEHCGIAAAFIGYSPSHTPNMWERFRVYIMLNYALTDKPQMIKGRDALAIIFPEADEQAGKLGQFFFGSIKGLYAPVQNISNEPQVLFDIYDVHQEREKEYKKALEMAKTMQMPKSSEHEDIFVLGETIPILNVIADHYSNCSYVQRGNMVNVINHDYGKTSAFYVYENTNSFCNYARTNSKGKTLGGNVATFLMEVAGLTPKEAAKYIENKLGLDADARLEAYKIEQGTQRLAEAGIKSRMAKNMPPEPEPPSEPVPLRKKPQEQRPYPIEALGEFSEVVQAVSDHVAAPLPMVAASMLATLSLCTQRLANVVHEGRIVLLSLYFLTIAGSGERKSTADEILTAVIREYEAAQFQGYKQALKEWKIDMRAYEVARKNIEKGKDIELIKQGLYGLGGEPEKPISPRVLLSNVNVEGIYRLYLEGVIFLGLFSDEAGIFFGGTSFANENKLKTISFLASIWSNGRADKVRMGEGDSHITNKRLAAHLMLQPVIADTLLDDELLQQQGFFPRFLFTASKSLKGTRLINGTPKGDIRQHKTVQDFYSVCRRLLVQEVQTDANDTPIFNELTLTADAQNIYRELYNATEQAQAEQGELAHVSNYASRCAEQALRIAGVLTLSKDHAAKNIDGVSMKQAASLAFWYLEEAKRLTENSGVSVEIVRAEKLLKWLNHNGEQFVTTQKMTQNTRLKDTKEVREALKLLKEHGHVRQAPRGTLINGSVSNTAWELIK